MLPKCLLIVGHAGYQGRGSGGAYSRALDANEYEINRPLANEICNAVNATGRAQCFWDEQTRANDVERWRSDAKGIAPNFIVEMHLNGSTDASAHGAEVLCWDSDNAEFLAALLLAPFTRPHPLAMRNRGVIRIGADDPRAWLTKAVAPPVFTMEPGFLSNAEDMKRLLADDAREMIAAYTRGIVAIAGRLAPDVTPQAEPVTIPPQQPAGPVGQAAAAVDAALASSGIPGDGQ